MPVSNVGENSVPPKLG